MESEIAGWLSVVFRFVHVLAAIMWIGNSLLFTWMELNLIAPKPDDSDEKKDLLGHLDMLHGGGVFHLQKKVINPQAIPVPLHWFMWQSYTTWISGVLLLISVFYIHGGAALVDATKTDITGWRAITLSAGAIIGWWLVYDTIWKSKLKDIPKVAIPLTFALLIAAAYLISNYFNGRALFLQIGAMMASSMTSNVFFHIIQNQKKFMKSLLAGLPHDMKYGKQAKTRSMHNHYMTFPVLFLMLSAHFPQLTSAAHNIPILAVIIISLMTVKHLMNSRYYFRQWLVSIFATFILACVAIGLLLHAPVAKAVSSTSNPVPIDPAAEEGAKLFISQTCASCHLTGGSPIAPDLKGIFGSTVILADDSKVTADETYLRSSIKQPQLQIVKGFAPAMPPFAHLTDEQVDHLVAYLKSLK